MIIQKLIQIIIFINAFIIVKNQIPNKTNLQVLDQQLQDSQPFQQKQSFNQYFIEVQNSAKYLTVELDIVSEKIYRTQNFLLLVISQSKATLDTYRLIKASQNSYQLDKQFVYYDYDSYSQRLQNHKLKIPIYLHIGQKDPDQKSKIYISVFIEDISYFNIQYNINAFSTPSNYCMGECQQGSNNSFCNLGIYEQQQNCQCFGQLQIGSDCSKIAKQMTEGEQINMQTLPGEWVYTIINLDINETQGYQIEIGSHTYQGGLSLMFPDNSRGSLPNFQENYYQLNSSSQSVFYHISQEFIIENKNQNVQSIVTVYLGYYQEFLNSNSASEIISLKYESLKVEEEDTSQQLTKTHIYIILAISGGFILIFFISTSIKICITDRRERQIRIQRRNQRNLEILSRRKKMEKNIINFQLIDECMPTQKFIDFQLYNSQQQPQMDIQTECTICLVDFEQNSDIKHTFCKHTFHADCLQQWLTRQDNCPICRQSFLVCDIEEHLKLQKQKEMEQKQILELQINEKKQQNNNNISVTQIQNNEIQINLQQQQKESCDITQNNNNNNTVSKSTIDYNGVSSNKLIKQNQNLELQDINSNTDRFQIDTIHVLNNQSQNQLKYGTIKKRPSELQINYQQETNTQLLTQLTGRSNKQENEENIKPIESTTSQSQFINGQPRDFNFQSSQKKIQSKRMSYISTLEDEQFQNNTNGQTPTLQVNSRSNLFSPDINRQKQSRGSVSPQKRIRRGNSNQFSIGGNSLDFNNISEDISPINGQSQFKKNGNVSIISDSSPNSKLNRRFSNFEQYNRQILTNSNQGKLIQIQNASSFVTLPDNDQNSILTNNINNIIETTPRGNILQEFQNIQEEAYEQEDDVIQNRKTILQNRRQQLQEIKNLNFKKKIQNSSENSQDSN